MFFVIILVNNMKNKTKIKTKKKIKSKKTFLYNRNNPKKSFDIYSDNNPSDTIHIKYTTLQDVKDTIVKLEKLYKQKKYSHKRIYQVAMIMKVRLEVLKTKKEEQYKLAKKYLEFLRNRTQLNKNERYTTTFTFFL